jgi:formylglycine-generating enzyme required for sulfatase activity
MQFFLIIVLCISLTVNLPASEPPEGFFWRVSSVHTSRIVSIGTDGLLVWSNSAAGQVDLIQRAPLSAPTNWSNYVSVPVTNIVSSSKVFDLNPPQNMSLIPAGSFVMGDTFVEGNSNERPIHTNFISAFYMDQYEVTKALWDEVSEWAVTNGYSFGSAGSGKATNHPVHTVKWFDVVKWCNARSQRDGLTPVYYTDAGFTTLYKTGEIAPFANWSVNGYRLPTEAEWEKAARGGLEGQRFPWGNTITHSNANYFSTNSLAYDTSSTRGYHPTARATGGFPYTSPVGYFAPNGYGLYDMAGNVREWCWDWYGASYYSSSPSTDPRGPSSGSFRVLRDGSWFFNASFARVAVRGFDGPDVVNFYVGFRCARGL